MNLPPSWVEYLSGKGHEAVHWSSVGPIEAADTVIMDWARERSIVVLTHDLDFSALLASTGASGPSVVQVRTRDVMPEATGPYVAAALDKFATELAAGAIVSIDQPIPNGSWTWAGPNWTAHGENHIVAGIAGVISLLSC